MANLWGRAVLGGDRLNHNRQPAIQAALLSELWRSLDISFGDGPHCGSDRIAFVWGFVAGLGKGEQVRQ